MKNIINNNVFLKIFIVILMAFLVNICFASYENVTMTVESEPECKFYFTDYSYFEKKLVEKDTDNKEVTIQLSVVNNEPVDIPTGELMIVLDSSKSMNDQIGDKTRYEIVCSSAKQLVSKLLSGNDQLKIGIVNFSSAEDPNQEAQLDKDAQLISGFSNNISELHSAIDSIKYTGSRTNLDAGITLASQQFTNTSNEKYMVVLTDGVPNLAINDRNYFGDSVINTTKSKLQSISDSGINIITMLTGIKSPDHTPLPNISKTYEQIIEEIFGTTSNPTVGKFFYVQDSEIETTITETIYESLKPILESLKNIKITDYFPQEIIDNFDFAYVKDPTHGSISPSVNTSDNSIIWEIPEVNPNETAIVQYTLKLKEDYDPEILDKLINTNDGVDVEYDDFDGNPQKKHSDITPTLKLTSPLPSPLPSPSPSPSPKPSPSPSPKMVEPAPTILPKAGIPILITLFITLTGSSVYFLIKYKNIDNQLKH